jgi:hypothetical protein
MWDINTGEGMINFVVHNKAQKLYTCKDLFKNHWMNQGLTFMEESQKKDFISFVKV